MVEREVAWEQCRCIEGEEVVGDANRLLERAGNLVEQHEGWFGGWELTELQSWKGDNSAELGVVDQGAKVLEEAEGWRIAANSAGGW